MADHADELRLVVHSNPHDKDGETSVRAKDFPRCVRHDMQAQVAYKGIVISGERWLSRGHLWEQERAADRKPFVAMVIHVGKKIA